MHRWLLEIDPCLHSVLQKAVIGAISCLIISQLTTSGFAQGYSKTKEVQVQESTEEQAAQTKQAHKESGRPKSSNKPSSNQPESLPVTDQEKALVRELLQQLDSSLYRERVRAKTNLRKLDKRLKEILATIESPSSVESRIQLANIVGQVGIGALLNSQWQLESWPKKGGASELAGTKVVTFFKNGTFSDGDVQGEAETWSYSPGTQTIRLSYNGNYAVLIGKRTENGEFVGTAKNIQKQEWHFRLKIIER